MGVLKGVWLFGVASALCACSPSLTTLQPARTVPAGHVQLSASVQGTPPTGLPGEVLEEARAFDDIDGRPAAIEDAIDTASAGLLAPPSMDAQFGFAYGVSQRFELDAKVGPTGLGAGFRLQLMRRSPGIYLALGAMMHAQFRAFDIERFTDEASIESMRRFDFAFPLSLGYSGRYLHLWGGPKLVLTRFTSEFSLCVDSRGSACRSQPTVQASGRATYLAGQIGAAVGKGRVWLAVELTVARAWIRGEADVSMGLNSQSNEFARSGRILTPAVGIITWW